MKRPLFSSLFVLFGIALASIGASASFAALLAPAAAGAVPALGVAKVMLGQEFAYSGTAEWKQSRPRGPALTIDGAVKIAAAVSEAEPQKGYAVIIMRAFEPQRRPGQPNFPAEAEVTTVRYGADLTSTAPGAGPSSPIGELFQLLSVPLSPGTGLKEGEPWRHEEALHEVRARAEIVYTATGHAKVGDRDCLQIEKKLAQALPFKLGEGGGPELTDYGQTLCVDPESGLVVSQQVHQQVRFPTEEGPITFDLSGSISLQGTRQLPDTELAARVKQAAALDRVQRAVFTFRPGHRPAEGNGRRGPADRRPPEAISQQSLRSGARSSGPATGPDAERDGARGTPPGAARKTGSRLYLEEPGGQRANAGRLPG